MHLQEISNCNCISNTDLNMASLLKNSVVWTCMSQEPVWIHYHMVNQNLCQILLLRDSFGTQLHNKYLFGSSTITQMMLKIIVSNMFQINFRFTTYPCNDVLVFSLSSLSSCAYWCYSTIKTFICSLTHSNKKLNKQCSSIMFVPNTNKTFY
jgi:hypothetical protein